MTRTVQQSADDVVGVFFKNAEGPNMNMKGRPKLL